MVIILAGCAEQTDVKLTEPDGPSNSVKNVTSAEVEVLTPKTVTLSDFSEPSWYTDDVQISKIRNLTDTGNVWKLQDKSPAYQQAIRSFQSGKLGGYRVDMKILRSRTLSGSVAALRISSSPEGEQKIWDLHFDSHTGNFKAGTFDGYTFGNAMESSVDETMTVSVLGLFDKGQSFTVSVIPAIGNELGDFDEFAEGELQVVDLKITELHQSDLYSLAKTWFDSGSIE